MAEELDIFPNRNYNHTNMAIITSLKWIKFTLSIIYRPLKMHLFARLFNFYPHNKFTDLLLPSSLVLIHRFKQMETIVKLSVF